MDYLTFLMINDWLIWCFQFRKFCKKCVKMICSFGLWRESNTPDFELWQKNVISVSSTTWIFFKISSNRKRLTERALTQNDSAITNEPIRSRAPPDVGLLALMNFPSWDYWFLSEMFAHQARMLKPDLDLTKTDLDPIICPLQDRFFARISNNWNLYR